MRNIQETAALAGIHQQNLLRKAQDTQLLRQAGVDTSIRAEFKSLRGDFEETGRAFTAGVLGGVANLASIDGSGKEVDPLSLFTNPAIASMLGAIITGTATFFLTREKSYELPIDPQLKDQAIGRANERVVLMGLAGGAFMLLCSQGPKILDYLIPR